jgi:NAD(P)-dependent dehydrogenase (short-subunit alcohol dehydrogenase family)
MNLIALVTGADRGLGQSLCAGLLAQGWRVFAGQYLPDWPELAILSGQYPDRLHTLPLDVRSVESTTAAAAEIINCAGHLDLLVNNAGVTSPTNLRSIRESPDYAEMQRVYDTNALGMLRVVEACLPIMDRGGLKRLCFVSSEAGSIERMRRTAWYGYTMSKAALNMAVKILFNHLHPDGYSFRLYHPGWMRTYMGGTKNSNADMEPEEAAARALSFFMNPLEDEDHLALIDYQGETWPW